MNIDKELIKHAKQCKANRKDLLSVSYQTIFNTFIEIISKNFSGVNNENLNNALAQSFSLVEKRIEGLLMLGSYPSFLSFDKIKEKIQSTKPDDKMLNIKCILLTQGIGSNDIFTDNYDYLTKEISILLKKMIGDDIQPTGVDATFNALHVKGAGSHIKVDYRLSKDILEFSKDNGRDYYFSIAGAITGYLLFLCAAQAEAFLDSALDALIVNGKEMDVFSQKESFLESAKPAFFL